jgi:hypothetical protein
VGALGQATMGPNAGARAFVQEIKCWGKANHVDFGSARARVHFIRASSMYVAKLILNYLSSCSVTSPINMSQPISD